jgi:hypothetical protein
MPPKAGPAAPGNSHAASTPNAVVEPHIGAPKTIQPLNPGKGGPADLSASKKQELTRKVVKKVVKEALKEATEQLKDFTEEQLTTSAEDMTCAAWCQEQCQLSGHVSPACIGSQQGS